jgi:uncharacterized repeat protein (TIGR01451 family)
MLAIAMVVMLSVSASALAAQGWQVVSTSNTTVRPGDQLTYYVDVIDRGDVNSNGTPYTVTATLPSGMTGVSSEDFFFGFDCGSVAGLTTITCTSNQFVSPDTVQEVRITVAVDPGASGVLTARFDVSGGGLADASTVDPVTISATPPPFGIDAFDGQVSDAAGNPFTQAGGHPADLSTAVDINTATDTSPTPNPFQPIVGPTQPIEALKDVVVDLPPGLVGNPTGVSQCTTGQLSNTSGITPLPLCPITSQVGTATFLQDGTKFGNVLGPVPIFNMVPPPSVPARFGMNVAGTMVALDASVRTGSDYGLTVTARNAPAGLAISGTHIDFWGVPSDPSHDSERSCPGQPAAGLPGGPSCVSGAPRTAFFRNPTACTAPGVGVATTVHVDSWQHPGDFKQASFLSHTTPAYPFARSDWGAQIGPDGCNRVPFDPVLDAQPVAGTAAGGPSAFAFDITIPQDNNPDTVSQSDLKKAVVTLPQGVRVNPSSADGLQGCSPDQIALSGGAEPSCPDASKLGTVDIDSPLLDAPLIGSVYLAKPFDNPFGSLLAVYLAVNAEGVEIKVAGEVRTDPSTGQLTATFDNNPQLPFTRVHMVLNGGPRAPLTMPSACGSYTTRAVLTGWNGKVVNTTSTFTVSGDGHGGPCPGPKFAPGFTAGTQNPIAGGFSPFGLQLTRTDDDGEFSSLSSLSLPPGLLANVASIKTRCTIEQADAHACPTDSHIGEVTTGAGAGTNPFYVPGDVYLTGPYKGNPFGIAVIVHALAGPFDLGYVVVKGAIQIHDDGSVTVATDPFPTILQGIPLQVKDIRVNLDRPGFTFNPTSCNPTSINGTAQSTANQQAGVSSRFQVGECANLAFKPKFSASTAGKTSKANGASFHVHLASNEGPHGTGSAGESNIAKVDVQLPVSLPARLTTLQKACTAAQFASNPAGCPAASFVGSATAHTPILASPLSGPAILVSHGGQAFPDLVLVLQGEGVRLNLTGHTQIKKGITFSHFETVPDAPVASFDLTLPQGPHSALTTDIPGRNLCANTRTVTVTKRVTRRVHGHNRKVTVKAKKAVSASLLMPTTITAQNGAVIHQNTKIAVTGCAKTTRTKAKKARAKKGGKH